MQRKRDRVYLEVCSICGKEFRKFKSAKCCSEGCSIILKIRTMSNWRDRNKDKLPLYNKYEKKGFTNKKCIFCQNNFIPKVGNQICCSKECSKKHKRITTSYWMNNTESGVNSYNNTKIKANIRDKKNYIKKKAYCVQVKGNKCEFCGVGDLPPACFSFHHRNPDEKKCSINALLGRSRGDNLLEEELEKCSLLCNYCHIIYHNGNIRVSDIIQNKELFSR